MQINAFGLTDTGRVRDENQDAYFIDAAHNVFAVADGLGGLPGGADASRRIVELLHQSMGRINSEEERFDLAELIIGINKIISKESQVAHPITGSGSTLTLCQILEDQLFIGHVGDSATYLSRDGKFEKLTIDHTMAQELVDKHGESALEFMPQEYPHTLTRCIGQEGELRVDQTRIKLQSGDRIMLCTDGLNKVVPESEIADIVGAQLEPEQICTQLKDKANANQGPDNITVITLFLS
jgi:protein phosphatase